MPFYQYHCSKCDGKFENFHSMSIKLTICELCGETMCLERLPGNVTVTQDTGIGRIVKDFIKENKEINEMEKDRLSRQEYKK